MPRAKPPPSANPMDGIRDGKTGAAWRESSRPKACTDRIIFPRLFTANPTFPAPSTTTSWHLGCHNSLDACKGTRGLLGITLVRPNRYSNWLPWRQQSGDEIPVFLLSCGQL